MTLVLQWGVFILQNLLIEPRLSSSFFILMQIEGEFPDLLPIRESLIRYVFEPNSHQV